MSYFSAIQYNDSGALDAFSRLRISNTETLFSVQSQYNACPIEMEGGATGTGVAPVWDANTRMVALTCAAGTGVSYYQSYQYCPYEPGRCRNINDYVFLADGSRVKFGDLIGKTFQINTIEGSKEAVATLNAYEPTYTLITQSGKQLSANRQHPLWVTKKSYNTVDGKYKNGSPLILNKGSWVNLEDIVVGDMVAVNDKLDLFANVFMDEREAKLLGYMIGDGSTRCDSPAFTQLPNKQLDEVRELAESYDCHLQQSKSNTYTYNIYSVDKNRKGKRSDGKNEIINILRKYELWGHNTYTKFIPHAIYETTKENTAVFLSRLYSTDGWASIGSDGDGEIGYCSVSKRLILDLQELLLKFGIHGMISEKNTIYEKSHYKKYNLTIYSKKDLLTFIEEIGIYGKEEKIEEVRKYAENLKSNYTYQYKNIEEGLKWESVKEIREDGMNWTVAVEVPGLNTYLSTFYEHNSQFIAATGVIGTGVAGHVVDYGYGDSLNGIFLRQNGASGLQVVQRSSTSGSVVETIVNQSSWNIDKMDGTGSSAITFDVTKAMILIIDLQFLGMGRVRLGFDINGVIYYFHQFLNANILSVPYMQSATLPFSVTLTSTTSAAPKTVYFKCATVQSEGGNLSGYGNDFCTPEGTVTAGNGTRTHLLSLRPKTTFGGIPNRAMFILNNVDLTVTGTAPIFYEVVVGATFSVAPTYADVNTTNSAFEYGTGGTFSSLTNGIVISSGYIQSGTNWRQAIADKIALHYPITLNRAGAVRAMGTLSILVSGIGATSATRGAVGYTEIK